MESGPHICCQSPQMKGVHTQFSMHMCICNITWSIQNNVHNCTGRQVQALSHPKIIQERYWRWGCYLSPRAFHYILSRGWSTCGLQLIIFTAFHTQSTERVHHTPTIYSIALHTMESEHRVTWNGGVASCSGKPKEVNKHAATLAPWTVASLYINILRFTCISCI